MPQLGQRAGPFLNKLSGKRRRQGMQSVEKTTYSTSARRFHWWTVALLAVQVPLGLYMVYRGAVTNFDGLTGTLYSSHKMLGLIILALVVARLLYRLIHGAPPDEPTITWWQRAASHVTHWSLYLLLIVVPLAGWAGVSFYGARDLFGIVEIPALGGPSITGEASEAARAAAQKTAEGIILPLHRALALLTVGLIAMHIGAAVVLHYFIRGDGVLARMLPWAGRRSPAS
jgi:cytochrome b561